MRMVEILRTLFILSMASKIRACVATMTLRSQTVGIKTPKRGLSQILMIGTRTHAERNLARSLRLRTLNLIERLHPIMTIMGRCSCNELNVTLVMRLVWTATNFRIFRMKQDSYNHARFTITVRIIQIMVAIIIPTIIKAATDHVIILMMIIHNRLCWVLLLVTVWNSTHSKETKIMGDQLEFSIPIPRRPTRMGIFQQLIICAVPRRAISYDTDPISARPENNLQSA